MRESTQSLFRGGRVSHVNRRPRRRKARLRDNWLRDNRVQLRVYDSPDEIEDIWREFERTANASCYQRFDFVSAWHQHIGRRTGHRPYIIAAFNESGDPTFIWPLMAKRRFFLTYLVWPGGKHANYNMGLTDPDWIDTIDRDAIWAVFQTARRQSRFDAVILFNQPETWCGKLNPFFCLANDPSPSFAYCIDLTDGLDAHVGRYRSSKFTKRMRRQLRGLNTMGGINMRRARTRQEALEFLDLHFSQKTARFLQKGLSDPFSEPGLKSFYRDLATRRPGSRNPPLALYSLNVGGQSCGCYGGSESDGRFSAFFNSIDISLGNGFSIGDVSLWFLGKSLTRRGVTALDLGIGEARYKDQWCNVTDRLFDSCLSMSLRGMVAATMYRNLRRAKRTVKQTPWLWRLASHFT